jgi:hypothetical protein
MPIELKHSAVQKIKNYLNEQIKDIFPPKNTYTVLIVRVEMNENGDDFECMDLVMKYYDTRDYALRVLENFVYEASDSKLFMVGFVIDQRKRYLTDANNQLYVVYHNPKVYTHYPLLLEKKPEPNTIRCKGEGRADSDKQQSACERGFCEHETARD